MIKEPWNQERYFGEGNQSKDTEAKKIDSVEENSADEDLERKKKARSVIITMLCMYLPALLGVAVLTYEILYPPLNLKLNELDLKQGIVASVYSTGGRTPKAMLQLKLASGDLATYRYNEAKQKQFTALIGKEVRIWGQPGFIFLDL